MWVSDEVGVWGGAEKAKPTYALYILIQKFKM